MKIISWNINGIRAVLKKGFLEFLALERPDIICLQEIKIDQETLAKEKLKFPAYASFFFSAKRPGYSGTAILIKEELLDRFQLRNGFAIKEYDDEGRVQILEAKDFFLLNVYFPNSNQELSRLPFKESFNKDLLSFIKKLEKTKAVIVCGDFNVAHEEIDLARPAENTHSAGFTKEERFWFNKYLEAGFIDSFRHLWPKKIQYSWWSYRTRARLRNIGWRIDYFLVSKSLEQIISKAYILDQVEGSDHAPVVLEIK